METSIQKHISGLLKQYIVAAGNVQFTHEGFQKFIRERAKENKGKPPLSPGAEKTQAVADYMDSEPVYFKHDTEKAFDKRLIEILQGVDNSASDSDNVAWVMKQIAVAQCKFDAQDKVTIRISTVLNSSEFLDVKSDNLNAVANIGEIPKAPTKPPKSTIGAIAQTIRKADIAVTKAMHEKQNSAVGMLKSDLGIAPTNYDWVTVPQDSETFRQLLYSLRYTYSLKTQEAVAENDGVEIIR